MGDLFYWNYLNLFEFFQMKGRRKRLTTKITVIIVKTLIRCVNFLVLLLRVPRVAGLIFPKGM